MVDARALTLATRILALMIMLRRGRLDVDLMTASIGGRWNEADVLSGGLGRLYQCLSVVEQDCDLVIVLRHFPREFLVASQHSAESHEGSDDRQAGLGRLGLRRPADNTETPCSVKAHGAYRRPQLEMPVWRVLELIAGYLESEILREPILVPPDSPHELAGSTPESSARSESSMTFSPRMT